MHCASVDLSPPWGKYFLASVAFNAYGPSVTCLASWCTRGSHCQNYCKIELKCFDLCKHSTQWPQPIVSASQTPLKISTRKFRYQTIKILFVLMTAFTTGCTTNIHQEMKSPPRKMHFRIQKCRIAENGQVKQNRAGMCEETRPLVQCLPRKTHTQMIPPIRASLAFGDAYIVLKFFVNKNNWFLSWQEHSRRHQWSPNLHGQYDWNSQPAQHLCRKKCLHHWFLENWTIHEDWQKQWKNRVKHYLPRTDPVPNEVEFANMIERWDPKKKKYANQYISIKVSPPFGPDIVQLYKEANQK